MALEQRLKFKVHGVFSMQGSLSEGRGNGRLLLVDNQHIRIVEAI